MAWAPRRRWPLPRGASRADIEAAYPGWEVIDEDAIDLSGVPLYRYVRNADPRIYRLRRDGELTAARRRRGINPDVLRYAARRLARYAPATKAADVLKPFSLDRDRSGPSP